MARGKHHKPLFELLGSARVPDPGPAMPEPPRREPAASRDVPTRREAEDPAAVAIEPVGEGSHRRVAVPLLTLYMAGTFVVVLCIVSFSVGYSMGGRPAADGAAGEDAIPPYRLLDDVIDPGRAEPAGGGSTAGATTPEGPAGSGATRAGGGTSTRPRGDLLGAGGPLLEDPRAGGNNYLQLAMLDRAGAEAAIGVLADGGVAAMAYKPPRSSRYRVIALDVAVSSEQYRSSAKERSEYEREIGRIGTAWKRNGGPTDFGDRFWQLFAP